MLTNLSEVVAPHEKAFHRSVALHPFGEGVETRIVYVVAAQVEPVPVFVRGKCILRTAVAKSVEKSYPVHVPKTIP